MPTKEETKFKVGDKVIIKKLEIGSYEGGVGYTKGMLHLAGKMAMIKKVIEHTTYTGEEVTIYYITLTGSSELDSDIESSERYNWTESMLEHFYEKESKNDNALFEEVYKILRG